MALDYNKLMEELEKNLGLEKPATESISTPKPTRGFSKKQGKAFEGFDQVEAELAQSLGVSGGEFGYEEGNPEDEEQTPMDILKDALRAAYQDLQEQGESDITGTLRTLADEVFAEFEGDGEGEPEQPGEGTAEEGVIEQECQEGIVDRLLALGGAKRMKAAKEGEEVATPPEEVATHTIANQANEALGGYDDPRFQAIEDKVIQRIREATDLDPEFVEEAISDIQTEGITEFMGFEDKTPEELEEILSSEEKTEQAINEYLDWMRSSYPSGGGDTTPPAEEGCGSKEGEQDEDAAFEALSAKMLDRYKSLAKPHKKNSSAMEGQGTKEKPSIDERAIARTSAEFGYSGQNLRELVTEALEKGVI